MAAIARSSTMTRSQINNREQITRIRDWVVRIAAYVLLSGVAFLMVFPFLYMFFTSLKQTQDVYHSPPRLLPYSAETVEYDGKQVSVYEFEINGQTHRMIIDDSAGVTTFGFFTTSDQLNSADPQSSTGLQQIRLADTQDTGKTQEVGKNKFSLYSVTVNGEAKELLLAYKRGLKRFVDINDPTIETYASERTAKISEKVDPQYQNYSTVINLKNLDRSLVNTAVVTILVTLGQVITSLLGGYAFSRLKFRGRNAVFMVYLGTIMIPFVVLIIPLYQLMVIIGWQGKIASLILPWIFTAYGTFLMRQFFITIPKDLEEAALLDGLSRLGILWRIFVPLSGPAIATQAIITFLYAWNSFLWPLVIIGDSNTTNHVVTLSLRQLKTAAAAEPNLVLTGAAVAILPPLILFVLAQRYFVEGIANTGIK
ncbi:MAG: ABC transporter permease subunit [Anaerolineaceae bacterium]|nr:ABC transporter permease subunit [Anaerolineaceae bacterium]